MARIARLRTLQLSIPRAVVDLASAARSGHTGAVAPNLDIRVVRRERVPLQAMSFAPVSVCDRPRAGLRVLFRCGQHEVRGVDTPAMQADATTGARLGTVMALVIHLTMIGFTTLRQMNAMRKFVSNAMCETGTTRRINARTDSNLRVAVSIETSRPMPAPVARLDDFVCEPGRKVSHELNSSRSPGGWLASPGL